MIEVSQDGAGAEAFTAPPSAAAVRAEIWRSLVSMLRVYAYAAGVTNKTCKVTETVAGKALVQTETATLDLDFDPANGRASWRIKKKGFHQTSGLFTMNVTGSIEFDGREKELDQAALDWIEDLTRTATA